ncbi:hypothetical protein D3C71_1150450 [compost metagenome]
MHARRAHDEVQAGRKQRGNQQVDHQHREIWRARRQQRQQHQRNHQRRATELEPALGLAQRRLGQAGVAAHALRLAHEAPGAPDQHHGHHQKLHHQRELGERHAETEDVHHAQPDADGLDFGDQQGRDISARNGAHAAHHDHHKRCADGVEVHLQRGGFARQLQRTAQARQQRAQSKHRREQPGLVHAQGADHFAVLRSSAHQRAPACAGEQQPQEAQHHRAHDDQKQVIRRELPPQDVDRARQPRRARAQQFFRPPEPQRSVLDDQHQRKRGQQLEQLGRLVDAAQQHHLHQSAQRPHHPRRQQQRGPEAQAGAQLGHQRIGHIDADHEERAMRKVDDARDTEDQRQPGAHQEQRGGPRQSVEQLNDKTRKTHSTSFGVTARSIPAGRRLRYGSEIRGSWQGGSPPRPCAAVSRRGAFS